MVSSDEEVYLELEQPSALVQAAGLQGQRLNFPSTDQEAVSDKGGGVAAAAAAPVGSSASATLPLAQPETVAKRLTMGQIIVLHLSQPSVAKLVFQVYRAPMVQPEKKKGSRCFRCEFSVSN